MPLNKRERGVNTSLRPLNGRKLGRVYRARKRKCVTNIAEVYKTIQQNLRNL